MSHTLFLETFLWGSTAWCSGAGKFCWQEFTSIKSMLQRAYDMVSNEIEKAEGPDERMAQSSEEKLLKLRGSLLKLALEPFLACTARCGDCWVLNCSVEHDTDLCFESLNPIDGLLMLGVRNGSVWGVRCQLLAVREFGVACQLRAQGIESIGQWKEREALFERFMLTDPYVKETAEQAASESEQRPAYHTLGYVEFSRNVQGSVSTGPWARLPYFAISHAIDVARFLLWKLPRKFPQEVLDTIVQSCRACQGLSCASFFTHSTFNIQPRSKKTLRNLRPLIVFNLLYIVIACKVQWSLASSLESLQTVVDTCNSAMRQLKSLANASISLCNQWKSSKDALEKHMKDEETNRKKEEERLRKLQERHMAQWISSSLGPRTCAVCIDFNMYLHCEQLAFLERVRETSSASWISVFFVTVLILMFYSLTIDVILNI